MIEFILGIRTPLSTTSMPASARMTSNRLGNFPSRSLIRNRARQPASSKSITRFLAACAAQDAVGWAVAPRILIRRLAYSITASTCRRAPDRVTKSQASKASAWERRKSAHVVELRSGAGSIPASCRIIGRRDARDQLGSAYQIFDSIGAAAFAERARIELRATGAQALKRTTGTPDVLTAQEALIARLASQGASNPQIAAQLFISPATVAYHLGKVFAKLGISSRSRLAQSAPHPAGRDAGGHIARLSLPRTTRAW
jgi:DNA-binding CsgD family transcriptional regulator